MIVSCTDQKKKMHTHKIKNINGPEKKMKRERQEGAKIENRMEQAVGYTDLIENAVHLLAKTSTKLR